MQEVAVETTARCPSARSVFHRGAGAPCLDKNDHVRAQISSRKINPRSFDEIVKSEKKAALEAARKAGEDAADGLDAAGDERGGAGKERLAERQRRARGGYYEATDPSIPRWSSSA